MVNEIERDPVGDDLSGLLTDDEAETVRARIGRLLRTLSADWAVLTNPETVCYATGHVVPIETGPSPFAGGPTLAFVGRDGTAALVAANAEPVAAGGLDTVEPYTGFTITERIDQAMSYTDAVRRLASRLGVGGRLAVEMDYLTHAVGLVLPHAGLVDIRPGLDRLRMIKSPGERRALGRAAEVAAHGQRIARAMAKSGATELEVFGRARTAMERLAGARTPLAGDFLSGRQRTSAAGGWPIERVIERGDPIICDLAPRVAGYWGDSCGSFVVGRPTSSYERLFAAAHEALLLSLDIIRPGLPIADLDGRLQAVVARHGFAYPHHSGHSIGTGVHEYPRLVPYETLPLEAGMVLMVEPAAYHPDIGGARLEWMIEVEADGCRPVAPFPLRPSTDDELSPSP